MYSISIRARFGAAHVVPGNITANITSHAHREPIALSPNATGGATTFISRRLRLPRNPYQRLQRIARELQPRGDIHIPGDRQLVIRP
jgi:hypothetical protein